jgi:hypothetical protein
VDSAASNESSSNRSASASATSKVIGRCSFGSAAALFEKGRDVIGRRHVRKPVGRGERRLAVSRSHVEHLFAGVEVDRFAERLANHLEAHADLPEISRSPRRLLPGLDCGEVAGVMVIICVPIALKGTTAFSPATGSPG